MTGNRRRSLTEPLTAYSRRGNRRQMEYDYSAGRHWVKRSTSTEPNHLHISGAKNFAKATAKRLFGVQLSDWSLTKQHH